MRSPKVLIITLAVMLFLEWYGFQAVKAATYQASPGWQRFVRLLYWSFPVVGLGLMLASFLLGSDVLMRYKLARNFLLTYVFIGYMSKLVMVPFLLLDDVGRLFRYVASLFQPQAPTPPAVPITPDAHPMQAAGVQPGITRSAFLSQAALVAAAVPAFGFTYGVVSGAHDYHLRRIKLPIKGLPKAFHGLTIGQLSDIHSGSFFNKRAVQGGVEMLRQQKPDVFFFTGDLVNDRASEVGDYKQVFSKITAPLGVYSVLGNHDYGDYAGWETPEAKRRNLLDLMRIHKEMGYDLLMDEHRFIEVGGERIAILGNQNWGTGGFAQYGNLARAYAGTQEAPVKLLLSHDPSHWDAQVRPRFPDISVQFAGHTHGMQFGIESKFLRWSPVQYRYKQWAGLYTEANQHLYVNRGFGFIGYPGRLGIWPEITIFELQSV